MQQLRSRIPTGLAYLVGFLAFWQFLTIFSPGFRRITYLLREYLNAYYFWFPTANLAWVVALVLLTGALLARKRLAWGLLLLVVLSMIVNDITFVLGGDRPAWGGLIFQLVILALLIVGAPAFVARVRKRAWLRAVVFWIVSFGISVVIGVLLVRRFPGSLPTTEDQVLWTLHQLLGGVGEPLIGITGRGPIGLAFLLGLLGSIVLIGTTVIAFRSVRLANTMTERDHALLRALIERYSGADSLAYFATRRDKAVIFSDDGLAAVTYRVEIEVCLASGDPIGDPDSWDAAIAAWRGHCRRYGLAPSVMGASAQGAQAYARHGLSVLRLGDEARLMTGDLTLRGPERADLRQAVARARRAGLHVRIRRQRELSEPELEHCRTLARRWRDTEEERGFSMALGRFGEPEDGECLVVEALQGEGEDEAAVALLSFVPWGPNGVSLDLMRRSPVAPNGTVELMVTEVCARGDDLGISRLSLNFAVFRSVFEQGAQLGAGPLVRRWRSLLVFASRWWQLESLYRANDKFGPIWEPRFLAYADARWIPRIGLAAAIAEGFVTHPFRGNDRRRAVEPVAPIDPAELPVAVSREPRRPEQVRVRIAKAQALQADGIDPWPVAEPPSHTIAAARAADHGAPVTVAGRVLGLRDLGGVVFCDVRDWSGTIQVVFDATRIGAEGVERVTHLVDLGDLVAVVGVRGQSRSGEESILGDGIRLEAKSASCPIRGAAAWSTSPGNGPW